MKKVLPALFFLSILLVSCSSNDDNIKPDGADDETGRYPAKKLVTRQYWYSDSGLKIGYDGNRFISRAFESSDYLLTFSYEANTITSSIYTMDLWYSYYNIYTLDSKNRISKMQIMYVTDPNDERMRWDINYYYNDEGYLAQIDFYNGLKDLYYRELREYADGNLSTIKFMYYYDGEVSYSYTSTFSYTDLPDKLGITSMPAEYMNVSYFNRIKELNVENIWYQLGYFGKKSKNLVSEIRYVTTERVSKIEYFYHLDNDGFVDYFFEDNRKTKLFYDK